jgi:hypothetical protein
MDQAQHIKLTIQPQGVINPLLRAFHDAIEIVSICHPAIQTAELSQSVTSEGSIRVVLTDPNPRPDIERRTHYSNWLLSKGFQEYARGVRATLEEAYFYNDLVLRARKTTGNSETTWPAFQQELQEVRRKAGQMRFPILMNEVNRNLISPLHFEAEFLSLQKVRNCLEHRNGVVGTEDVDRRDSSLKLSFPRLRFSAKAEGKEEVEVNVGSYIEKDSVIKAGFVSEVRSFKLGEKVLITLKDFCDIGWGCWAFADELGKKLLKLESAVTL